MSVTVIDMLEVIQIQQCQRKCPARPSEIGNQLFHRLIEIFAVKGTGQLVHNDGFLPFPLQLKAIIN
ncbi:hypothetical protein D3C81_1812910 [compost metagenome]